MNTTTLEFCSNKNVTYNAESQKAKKATDNYKLF